MTLTESAAVGIEHGSEPFRLVRFTVLGTPAPQGSKRHVGHGRMVESSKKVGPWRESVVSAWLRLWEDTGNPDAWTPLDMALQLRVVFSLKRPASHYRTGRNSHLLRDNAPSRPAKYPDLSKLIRSTEDGMTTAGVYVDDALIVSEIADKVFAGSAEGLRTPGAVIELWTVR
jgi:Holliday junction resolvase RusA-like endonuclease